MPTVRAFNGMNVVASGESHAFSVGSDYTLGSAGHRGLIFCHGANLDEKFLAGYAESSARDCLRYPVQTPGGGSPASRYALLSTTQSGGGENLRLLSFGNANSSARMADARTFLLASSGVTGGKIAIIGLSMGFLVACNYVRNVLGSSAPSLIAGMIGVNPGVSLSWARGRDNRHRVPVSVTGTGTIGSAIPTGGAPANIVDNINGLGPDPSNMRGNYQFVENDETTGDVTRRWPIASATTSSLTLVAPGVTSPGVPRVSHLYSVRPQNDPTTGLSSASGADYGTFWGAVNAAYAPDETDAGYDSSVAPTRNPLSFLASDPFFEVPCQLFYNPNDEVVPAGLVAAFATLWNADNPGNCTATSSGDGSALHRNWKLDGPTLHSYLEGFSW